MGNRIQIPTNSVGLREGKRECCNIITGRNLVLQTPLPGEYYEVCRTSRLRFI